MDTTDEGLRGTYHGLATQGAVGALFDMTAKYADSLTAEDVVGYLE